MSLEFPDGVRNLGAIDKEARYYSAAKVFDDESLGSCDIAIIGCSKSKRQRLGSWRKAPDDLQIAGEPDAVRLSRKPFGNPPPNSTRSYQPFMCKLMHICVDRDSASLRISSVVPSD